MTGDDEDDAQMPNARCMMRREMQSLESLWLVLLFLFLSWTLSAEILRSGGAPLPIAKVEKWIPSNFFLFTL